MVVIGSFPLITNGLLFRILNVSYQLRIEQDFTFQEEARKEL